MVTGNPNREIIIVSCSSCLLGSGTGLEESDRLKEFIGQIDSLDIWDYHLVSWFLHFYFGISQGKHDYYQFKIIISTQ